MRRALLLLVGLTALATLATSAAALRGAQGEEEPLGNVRVRVAGPDGAPLLLRPARVHATEARDADATGEPRVWSAPVQGGVARFSEIPVGLRLELVYSAPGAPPAEPTVAEGPRRAGGTRVVELRPVDDAPIVSMQLFGPDDQPLGGTLVDVTLRVDGGRHEGSRKSRIATGPDGRLMRLVSVPWERGTRRTLELRCSEAAGVMRLDLTGELGPGVHDLGEVRFGSERVVLAGRVVDEAGAPVPRVAVFIDELVGERNDEQWRPFQRPTVRTDEEGRFELSGLFPGDPHLRLRVRSPRHAETPPYEVAFGELELLLTVRAQTTGRMRGTLLLDEGVPLEELLVFAEADDGDRHPAVLRRGGRFELAGIEAGTYDLVVAGYRFAGEAARVPDVQVVGGEQASDARLKRLDLTDALRVAHVTVRGADGASLPWFEVRFREDPEARWSVRRVVGGEAATLVSVTALEVEVHAEGRRAERLADATGAHELLLAPGLDVTLALDGGRPKLPKNVELALALRDPGPDGLPAFGAPRAVDAQGRLAYRAPRPGAADVFAFVERSESSVVRRVPIGAAEIARIEVLAQEGAQIFALQLQDEELERALELLAGD